MYSITLRETNQPVTVRSQPDFSKQVETNRKVRELIGDKASGVLLVQVMTPDFEVIRVDSKALIVRFYHSKDKERQDLFTQAEAFMVAGDKVQSEECFWLAITKVSLVDSGCVNPDGSLKPYSSYPRRKEQPLSAQEVDSGDFMYPF